MQKIDDLVQEVIDRAKKLGISMQGLSALAGLHKNTLRGIKKPGWSPSTSTLGQLQKTILHLESLSHESLCVLAEQNKIHPPKVPGQKRPKKKKPITSKKPKNTKKCAFLNS